MKRFTVLTLIGLAMVFAAGSAYAERIYSFDKTVGKEGRALGEFQGPIGIAIDSDGFLYVSDAENNRIQTPNQKIRSSRKICGFAGNAGRVWPGKLHYPTDLAISRDGNLIIADAYNNRIQKMTTDGKPLEKWGGLWGFGIPGSWVGYFKVATGITVDREGRIYAADFYNNRLQKFSSTGKVLSVFQGQGNESLKYPTDVAVDAKGNIWVVDFGHNRIVRLRRDILHGKL